MDELDTLLKEYAQVAMLGYPVKQVNAMLDQLQDREVWTNSLQDLRHRIRAIDPDIKIEQEALKRWGYCRPIHQIVADLRRARYASEKLRYRAHSRAHATTREARSYWASRTIGDLEAELERARQRFP